MTKKDIQRVLNYERATATTIYEVYAKPCQANVEAYNRLREEMERVGGYGFKVFNATSHSWCCAYEVLIDEKPYLIYYTRDNKYVIEL